MEKLTWLFFQRVIVAALLGGLVGIEREINEKPAGVKDIILVSVTSCILGFLSVVVATKNGVIVSDPARIAAHIIPGIGFIGAGVILKDRRSIFGLTSAASIWFITAIGLTCGLGYLLEALILTITLLITLVLFRKISQFVAIKKVQIVIVYETLTIEHQLKLTEIFSKSAFKLVSIKSKKDGKTEFKLIANNRSLKELESIFNNSPVAVSTHSITEL